VFAALSWPAQCGPFLCAPVDKELEKLRKLDERLLEGRRNVLFAGVTETEIADSPGVNERTVGRD
jgi:hypothetical protein